MKGFQGLRFKGFLVSGFRVYAGVLVLGAHFQSNAVLGLFLCQVQVVDEVTR